ncbi:hypothetical protein KSC_101180 [Ktedonobacter sp. SOSP1-52]|uniref:L-rhamnose mutarotase n=1 Tax=Ktedonobacter sp. SOSP1-52 TaxID=2778366 RepID=UPI00191641A1|nr:L-rhamnose mutarotase [Ktedonobacter sp. SOSP1-52]GHO71226.1 hypothetical protein KSC_101180 [Ktedonobacter sp. SOSP1-52]
MRHYGQVIRIKPDCIEEYERMHASVWPEVLATIHACNMRNYTIFRYKTWLFAYFEYVGDDFAVDMKRMAQDPMTQQWWSHTDPMQEPVEGNTEGSWWTIMKDVFHTD